jgi:hypothetical protein
LIGGGWLEERMKSKKEKIYMIKVDEKHPDLIALRQEETKLQGLLGDRATAVSEVDRRTQLYLSRRQSNQQARLEAEADQLLGKTNANLDEDLKNIEVIEHSIAVLDIAIRKQALEVDGCRGRVSQHLCGMNRTLHIKIVQRISKALQELALANQEELDFFEALRDAGASSISLRPMRIGQVGIARDTQGVVAFHEREVQRYISEAVA